MRKYILFVFVVFAIISMNSCSTDFDVYSDYEDITIVYAIADISDDTTWVKITKAYTGPGNALIIAQNPDSSNYPYKLNANITGKKNGVETDPIILDTLTIHNKAKTDTIVNENGDTIILNPFYSPDQLLYYAPGKLDPDYIYTLRINKSNGETLSGETGMVREFYVDKPVNRIVFSETSDGSINWTSPENGVRFEIRLTFNYSEYAPGYSDTLYKSVDWFLGTRTADNGEGGESMEINYSGPYFYTVLESELPDIPNVTRWAEMVDITIACGSQVLSTYLDINSGSGTLLEEVPVYSNIDGGTGIFASRHTIVKPIQLSSTTERNLVENYDLGFKFKN